MRLEYVSASQIQDFSTRKGGCPRLWAMKKLAHVEQEKKGNQELGTDVHTLLEGWLLGGPEPIKANVLEHQDVPGVTFSYLAANEIAQTAVPLLVRHPQTLVEHYIQFPVYDGGPTMVGYIDQLEPPKFGSDGVLVGVEDHKTTSRGDWRYAKTADELATTIQMVVYAYWVFRFAHLATLLPVPPSQQYDLWLRLYDEPADLVKLSHTYMSTKGEFKATRRDKVVDWPAVAREWVHIEQEVKDMVALAATLPEGFEDIPNDDVRRETITDWLVHNVEGEPQRCRLYGGCQFRGRCPEAITGCKGENTELASVLAVIGGGKAMGTPAEDLAARLRERMGAKPLDVPKRETVDWKEVCPTCKGEVTPLNGSKLPDGSVKHTACPGSNTTVTGVIPPDAPSRTNEPDQQPSPDRHVGEGVTAPAGPAEPEPKRRRRSKAHASPTTATEPQVGATTPAMPSEPASGPPVAPEGPTKSAFGPAGAIFINCRPVVGFAEVDTMAWERWMSDMLEGLHAELKVLDYRLVDFGKGAGCRDAWLRKYLNTAPPVCVVHTSHPEAGAFLAIAAPKAQLLVK